MKNSGSKLFFLEHALGFSLMIIEVFSIEFSMANVDRFSAFGFAFELIGDSNLADSFQITNENVSMVTRSRGTSTRTD